MKRTILALTPGEVGTLRAALSTAQEEDSGKAVWNSYQRLLDRLETAPTVDREAWTEFADAAQQTLAMGEAKESCISESACRRFAGVMDVIFRTCIRMTIG